MSEIDTLVQALVNEGGSDLHLCSGRPPMIRVSGDILPLDAPPLDGAVVNRMLEEIMPKRAHEEFAEIHDTDFSYEIPDYVRLRVNVFRDRDGVGGVLRAIPAEVISADDIGLPKPIRDLCYLSKGLVVVTGPTGSGKSTTLAAMVDLINRTRSDHIITIEDPIEFVHRGQKCLVNQREVHTHTMGFARALRAALREDPDIVLVGEMRDLETIECAIETAETGHLVFGTLHTNSAIGTVDRVIDAFPANRQNQIRSMLANSLKGVIAQTLCRRIGGGRVAALEILIVDIGISALIRDGKNHQIPSAMQVGRALGMQMLNEALMELVCDGKVAAKEAYLKAVDKPDILSRFEKAGIPVPDMEL